MTSLVASTHTQELQRLRAQLQRAIALTNQDEAAKNIAIEDLLEELKIAELLAIEEEADIEHEQLQARTQIQQIIHKLINDPNRPKSSAVSSIKIQAIILGQISIAGMTAMTTQVAQGVYLHSVMHKRPLEHAQRTVLQQAVKDLFIPEETSAIEPEAVLLLPDADDHFDESLIDDLHIEQKPSAVLTPAAVLIPQKQLRPAMQVKKVDIQYLEQEAKKSNAPMHMTYIADTLVAARHHTHLILSKLALSRQLALTDQGLAQRLRNEVCVEVLNAIKLSMHDTHRAMYSNRDHLLLERFKPAVSRFQDLVGLVTHGGYGAGR